MAAYEVYRLNMSETKRMIEVRRNVVAANTAIDLLNLAIERRLRI